jgi:hypothetical protein
MGILIAGLTVIATISLAQDATQTKPLLLSYAQTEAYQESQSAACTDCGMAGMMGPGTTVHYPSTNVCISVYNDGSYSYARVEDKKQGKPKTKIYNGTLAAPELEKLKSILADSQFKSINPPNPEVEQPYDATGVKEGEAITITAMHEDGSMPQVLTLLKRHFTTNNSGGMEKYATNWDKLQKPLKPLLSFAHDLDKRGQSEGKAGETSCQMTASPF